MSSLWLGENHLVYVKGNGFLLPTTERYSRFRYQDIQYIAVSQTSRVWASVGFLLGMLAFGAGAGAIIFSNTGTTPTLDVVIWVAILLAVCLLFVILLARNWLLGPTCKCDLRTNLKRERLLPLNRLNVANQVADRVAQVVEKKQQAIFRGDGDIELGEKEMVTISYQKGRIAKSVFPAFINYLGFALVTLVGLHFQMVALWAAAVALVVLGSVALVVSIVRSYQLQTPDSVRQLLLSLLTASVMFGGVSGVYFFHIVQGESSYMSSPAGVFRAFAAIPGSGLLVYYLAFLLSALAILLFAVLGVVTAFRWQTKFNQYR